jgi:hypothetical protein
MDLILDVLYHSSGAVQYHTDQMLRKLTNAPHQLQASGADLGGELLFRGRLGFSGTPSDLLPQGLGNKCHLEPGSEASMIRVLSSPESVGTPIHLDAWLVLDILRKVAKHDPPLRALIDVGALVTGMSNEDVAKTLLEIDAENHPPRFEACVYLNEHDIEMVMARNSGEPIRLIYSAFKDKPESRFTFYDQIHTTGIDIKQSPDAHAAVTIGKDLNIRDFAQGCYRMRQLGEGQVVHCLWVPEVLKLIPRTGDDNLLPIDALAWLTSKYIESEVSQLPEFCRQQADSFPRSHALSQLLFAAPAECMEMDKQAAKLNHLARRSVDAQNHEFDSEKMSVGVFLAKGVVSFTTMSTVLCNRTFNSGIHRLSFINMGVSRDDDEGTQCGWGIGI